MAKGAVGLVAGYWPEDVFRYLACPNAALDDALAARQARRRADAPALTAGGQALTFGALQRAVDAAGAALLSLAPQGRLAVAVADPLEALVAVLGAARARLAVAVLDPGQAAEELDRALEAFGPTLALVAPPGVAGALRGRWPELQVLGPEELRAAAVETPRRWPPAQIASPAVALAARAGGLAYHSHASLVAAAVSWSAFLEVREGDLLATDCPVWRWEGLMWAAAALFRGGSAALGDPDGLGRIPADHPRVLRLTTAPSLLGVLEGPGREAAAWLRSGSGPILVSADGHLPTLLRHRAERALGRAVLPLLGRPETGPFLAGHPSWSPPDADGIPVTNADLWPLNPADGRPLRVPWEAVEYGEIGVRSPMAAVTYGSPERDDLLIQDGWHRTGLVASMDPNGLFFLRGEVAGGLRAPR